MTREHRIGGEERRGGRQVEIETARPQEHPLRVLNADLSEKLSTVLRQELTTPILPTPVKSDYDFGIQLAPYAKRTGRNPVELAADVGERLRTTGVKYVDQIGNVGPYVNVRVDLPRFGADVLNQVTAEGKDYGKEREPTGQRVVIDMSSPNIAKRMSYAHLRSTVIGDSLANILKAQGHEVIRDNHIGDWGTQFGKLITAIDRWSSIEKIEAQEDRVGALQELYVRFHDEVDIETETSLDGSSQLEREGRRRFRKLEEGDPEARAIWQKIVDWSMQEFDETYQTLGVSFDLTLGESFYEDRLQGAVQEVQNSGAATTSEGALVVDMEDDKLGTAIIQKSDGASVYMTRDLATAMYRERDLEADRQIYVVGADQKHYFQQLFEILRRTGHPIGDNSEHVYFGMVKLEEGKMSTRKGRTVLLNDVIDEGIHRAEEELRSRERPIYNDPEKRQTVARQVAVGALKWNDLSQGPRRNITFDWEDALNMEGYSAPYVQYTAVRAGSILQQSSPGENQILGTFTHEPEDQQGLEKELIMKIAAYPDEVKSAGEELNPSRVARYAFDLAQTYSRFYDQHRILDAQPESLRNSRLRLTASTRQVIENALGLLGIEVPEEM